MRIAPSISPTSEQQEVLEQCARCTIVVGSSGRARANRVVGSGGGEAG
jgi:hypothetical protein